MERIAPDFPGRLVTIGLELLERSPESVYAVRDDLTLCYLNPGWFEFARHNGGEPDISRRFGLGTSIADAISGDLRGYYETRFRRVLETRKPWDHDYECSTESLFRKFHQRIYPLRDGLALVVVNSLLVERDHDPAERPSRPAIGESYRDAAGFVTQCSFCRRFRRTNDHRIWDWIPEWVRSMPHDTSHSYCEVCFEYHLGFSASGP